MRHSVPFYLSKYVKLPYYLLYTAKSSKRKVKNTSFKSWCQNSSLSDHHYRVQSQAFQNSTMAASDTVKYGIIGAGMMGREHLINLHHLLNENVAVVAIADPHVPSQRLAHELARSYNWPIKVYSIPFNFINFLFVKYVR